MEGLTSSQLIEQGIHQIFKGDKRRLDENLGGQGWRYVVAAILIFPLTLVKCVDFMLSNKHLFHKHKETPMEKVEGIGLSMSSLKHNKHREFLENLEDYNIEAVKTKKGSNQKYEALEYLRCLINKDLRIKGTVLKTTFPKVSGEELLEYNETGELSKPFIVQRVTFGNEINKVLKTIFPLLKHRKMKGQEETYIVFEGDEIFELERKLRDLFMKPVTIVTRKMGT